MNIKIIHWLGVSACIVLIISCFLPWANYNDGTIRESFNGFYSHNNFYGKPGWFLVISGVVILIFMILPAIWAKRANLFISALVVGYCIKTYIVFASCYNNYCPVKQAGIYWMLISSVIILVASIFPDLGSTRKKD